VRERHLRVHTQWVERIRKTLLASAAARRCQLAIPASTAAQGLKALLDGLIQNWLLDPESFDLEAGGDRIVNAYFGGIGLR
jgi:TetR/AcrR family transcriptional regulator, acrAB operon repressor